MSNKNFNKYARYYREIYASKDYTNEANYVLKLAGEHLKGRLKILDIGCGAGDHARCFIEKGHEVHGVDLSAHMIDEANKAKENWHKVEANAAEFQVGDARNFRLNKQFDVVTSLFHVMCYQVSNDDLVAAFKTAYEHTKPGGLFIFDCWYGPGVLTDPPVVRVKRLSNNLVDMTRIAEPVHLPRENAVEINYTIQSVDKSDESFNQFSETHKVRYFFEPEIYAFLKESWGKFDMLKIEEWMTSNIPSLNSWNIVFVVKKTI